MTEPMPLGTPTETSVQDRPVSTRLSVVLPSFSAGADLARRTLESYAGQTRLDAFEVLLIDDGGLDGRVREVAQRNWPFTLRYLISPRTNDPTLAHKNHARNRGGRAATGDLLFLIDADCLVPPDFVESVLGLYRQIAPAGELVALYPLIANLHERWTPWIAEHGEDAIRTRWSDCIKAVGLGGDAFAGHMSERDRTPEGFKRIERHSEGFPVLSKRVFELLGGFDEDFLGWGANKEEFQKRINETSAIATYLLTSSVVYHQPHAKQAGNQKIRGNAALMHRKRSERQASEEWTERLRQISRFSQPPPPVEDLRQTIEAGEDDLQRLTPAPESRRITRVSLTKRLPERIRVAGPWVGEFGWQVARWQGGVRQHQQADPKSYLIVVGDPGGEVLYELADEYWWTPAFVAAQGYTRDMTGWKDKPQGEACWRALLSAIAAELAALHPGVPVEWMFPRYILPSDQAHRRLSPPSWAELERAMLVAKWPEGTRWACLFPRQRALNPHKNWPAAEWQALTAHLLDAHGLCSVIIGGEGDTAQLELDPATTLDLTRIPLERRLGLGLALLDKAALAIGSESGGSQLALMAGTPTVVLGSPPYEQRVTVDENPLKTVCRYLSEPGYRHTQVAVREAVASVLVERGHAEPGPRPARSGPALFGDLASTIAAHVAALSEPVLVALQKLPEVEPRDRYKDWFSSVEYYPVFAGLAAATSPRRVLEIGVRLGYSLVAFCHGASESVTRIVGIDDESTLPGSQARARANLLCSGFTGEHELLVGDRRQALEALRVHERFDLIHLDADVTEAGTRQAIEQAWAVLAPGGVLAVDDIDFHPEVGRAFAQMRRELGSLEQAVTMRTLRGLGVLVKEPLPVPAEPPSPVVCALCGEATRPEPGPPEARLMRCTACDLVRVDLSDPEFRKQWQSLYHQDGRYHREHQVAGHASLLARYFHDRALGRMRVENLKRFCSAGRLLDVGCSNGALVKAASEAGFDAMGFDADAWVVEFARRLTGCPMASGDLLELTAGPFDVITAIDVFEHFPTPVEHLTKLGSLLVPGGLLVIEMPDADEPGLSRLGADWRHMKPREHAFYWGARHVRALAERHGWRWLDSYVPYPDRRTYYLRGAEA